MVCSVLCASEIEKLEDEDRLVFRKTMTETKAKTHIELTIEKWIQDTESEIQKCQNIIVGKNKKYDADLISYSKGLRTGYRCKLYAISHVLMLLRKTDVTVRTYGLLLLDELSTSLTTLIRDYDDLKPSEKDICISLITRGIEGLKTKIEKDSRINP
jgi:hypothetical protein